MNINVPPFVLSNGSKVIYAKRTWEGKVEGEKPWEFGHLQALSFQ